MDGDRPADDGCAPCATEPAVESDATEQGATDDGECEADPTDEEDAPKEGGADELQPLSFKVVRHPMGDALVFSRRHAPDATPSPPPPPPARPPVRKGVGAYSLGIKAAGYISLYIVMIWILYHLGSVYGPELALHMTTNGWINVEGGPFCERLSMTGCVEACACKICLGPPPPHINIATAHSWRCIFNDAPCNENENATAQGCTHVKADRLSF